MKKYLILFYALFSSDVFACSFAPMFEPFKVSGENSPKPNVPDFEVAKIKRGSDDGNYASCSDAGMLSLTLRTKTIHPTGYLFKIIDGTMEDRLFYPEPIKPSIYFEEEGIFNFIWLDGSSEEQEEIEMSVEIIAVSKSGERSEPQVLKVSYPGVKKPWWKFW